MGDMKLVNGQYQPDICLTTSEWKRFRIVHADLEDPAELTVNGASCSLYLLSKDGVLIHGINNVVPREIPSKTMYFTVASRADVAIQCSTAGTYTITQGGTLIVNLVVTGAAGTVEELTPWNPLRPRYLQSRLFAQPDGNPSFEFDDDPMVVNGITFQDKDSPLFTVDVGTVQDFTLIGMDEHPFHVHINHFQILDCMNGPAGWAEVGDWIDTADFEGTVRFPTDTFGGRVVVHCHILEHEDEGLMGLFRIQGGCDALGGNIDAIGSACVWDSCDANVLNSSFSDYDWASESANWTPMVCAAAPLGAGAIAGIVIGCVCFVALVGGLVGFLLWRRKKKAEEAGANTTATVDANEEKQGDETADAGL